MNNASELNFDFEAFEEFTGSGPKRRERQDAYHSWREAFEARDDKDYQKLSLAEAHEFMQLLFSWPPLVEDARQIARNQGMVERLEAEGMTVEDAMKAANEKFPMKGNAYRLYDFGCWFCYRRDIHLPPIMGTRRLSVAFWRMIADGASQDETTIIDYLRNRRGIENLVPELGPQEARP